MWGVHGHFQEMALVDWDLSKQILSLILKCVHLFSLKGSKNFIKMIFRLFGITLFSKSIALDLFYTMADRILLEMGVFVEGEPMVDCDNTPDKSGARSALHSWLGFLCLQARWTAWRYSHTHHALWEALEVTGKHESTVCCWEWFPKSVLCGKHSQILQWLRVTGGSDSGSIRSFQYRHFWYIAFIDYELVSHPSYLVLLFWGSLLSSTSSRF